MSRRRQAKQREVLPDPRYSSVDLSKFINAVMVDGKKSLAENIVYKALDIAAQKLKSKSQLDLFKNMDCKMILN